MLYAHVLRYLSNGISLKKAVKSDQSSTRKARISRTESLNHGVARNAFIALFAHIHTTLYTIKTKLLQDITYLKVGIVVRFSIVSLQIGHYHIKTNSKHP